MLLRTGLHSLIEDRTPDGPIALVKRIHRCLSQTALVLVVPVPRQASANCLISALQGRRYTADTLVLEMPRDGAMDGYKYTYFDIELPHIHKEGPYPFIVLGFVQ